MPRLAFLVLVLALAGCGAREAAAPDPAKDTAAVQARVAEYLRSMLAGDGERACAQFTASYRRSAERRAKEGGLGSCADVFSLYGDAVAGTVPEIAATAADPALIVVSLEGDRAEAALKSPRGGLSVKRTTLRRAGALWLIDGLGVTRPRR